MIRADNVVTVTIKCVRFMMDVLLSTSGSINIESGMLVWINYEFLRVVV